ncbi:heparan-alpha-glucosaminide N-acetyltransferase domain-containing protein [uncultured Microbacterium sp.]|uniref:heparan-alpha-glucosaminide N-acetyltransferase domain-containing protein n=1 Tax=uncultured Microbacterium sp. TaxID=191216 RepID=UPI002603A5FF|nr:heparan-alpha-glucosaminide N-acetyltransferase domain-containing protein [uncultured Microbacterium sp.]
MRDALSRLDGASRISGIDLARGLAVIGMLAAHLLMTADSFVWNDPSTWTAVVDGRSSIMFAVLAGASIGIVTGGREPLARPEMEVARIRLLIRGCILWVIGILLALTGVPVYVILPAYAILFIAVIGFVGLRARTVLMIAAAIALVMPFVQPLLDDLPLWRAPVGAEIETYIGWHYPFTLWLVFVLAGLGAARTGLARLRIQIRMLVLGAVVSMLGYLLALVRVPGSSYLDAAFTAVPHSGGIGEVIGSGGFAVAAIGACLLLCRLRAVRMLSLPVRAMGSMPLTAYIAQLIVWAVAAAVLLGDTADLNGFLALAPFWSMTVGILVGCTAWALLFGRGPVEWALAKLSGFVGSGPVRQ